MWIPRRGSGYPAAVEHLEPGRHGTAQGTLLATACASGPKPYCEDAALRTTERCWTHGACINDKQGQGLTQDQALELCRLEGYFSCELTSCIHRQLEQGLDWLRVHSICDLEECFTEAAFSP